MFSAKYDIVNLYKSIFFTQNLLNISFKNMSFVTNLRYFSLTSFESKVFNSLIDQYFNELFRFSIFNTMLFRISISLIHHIFISFHTKIIL